MADFLISYTVNDRDWAYRIDAELKALGHQPHLQKWRLNTNVAIRAWIKQHQGPPPYVLCVISDNYLKEALCKLEDDSVLWQAVSQRRGLVLFVVVERSELPRLSVYIRRCELAGMPDDAARIRFREFITETESGVFQPARASPPKNGLSVQEPHAPPPGTAAPN